MRLTPILKSQMSCAAHSDRGSVFESLAIRGHQNTPTATFAHELSASTNDHPGTPMNFLFSVSHLPTTTTKPFSGSMVRAHIALSTGDFDQANLVEQVEMAFKTPAKINHDYDFGAR